MIIKPGLFGQRLSLMELLKAGTFAAHARLQGVAYFGALFACQLPLESYVGHLRALAVIHAELERELDGCADARVKSVWRDDMRKLPLLEHDLHGFEPRAVADIREAAEAALAAVEQLRPRTLEQPLALLGWLYVLEGSTLGAKVLAPATARAFLLSGNDGLAYLQCYGDRTTQRWQEYRLRMNALSLNEDECREVTHGANALFSLLESVLRALYPFKPESKTFSITSINPEAGRHPVPSDPREVEAAVRAGDRCWNKFPYFEHRYGERGLRFARSDAVWLATLCKHPPAQIARQVSWLGRVLAARGMPTLLLEDQLESLVEELVAAVPDQRADYEKLLDASAALREARRRHLSDAQVQAVADRFNQAVGGDWSARFPFTGELLASYVADERDGIDAALHGLLSWLDDKERFPAEWTAAVGQALQLARALAPAPSHGQGPHQQGAT